MDEMDVFGAFLLGEGAFDRLAVEPDLHVNLGSYTTDHDDYYMWRPELGPRPKKPRKFSVPLVERFVGSQVAERLPGWLESCGAALDLTIENLGAFEARRKPLLDSIEPAETRIEVVGTVALAGIGHALRLAEVLDGLVESACGAQRLIVLQRLGKKPRVVAARSLG